MARLIYFTIQSLDGYSEDAGGQFGWAEPGEELHQFINDFVREHGVAMVIDLGCGDGARLALARYPRYVGLDVSAEAVRLCGERFPGDAPKSFFCYDPAAFFVPPRAAYVPQAEVGQRAFPTTVWNGAIGFVDDWTKLTHRRSLGLPGRWKLLLPTRSRSASRACWAPTWSVPCRLTDSARSSRSMPSASRQRAWS